MNSFLRYMTDLTFSQTKFDDGIKQTIDWYLNNKAWWQNILSGDYQNYYKNMYGDRLKKSEE